MSRALHVTMSADGELFLEFPTVKIVIEDDDEVGWVAHCVVKMPGDLQNPWRDALTLTEVKECLRVDLAGITRAAIASLREPTPAIIDQIEAADERYCEGLHDTFREACEAAWMRAIDAALAEGEP